MKLPLNINLTDKVAVITGAGGVLCSAFSKALAQCGAKVAVLDLNEAAAQKVADEITAEGNKAIAVKVNCLDSASLNEAHDKVVAAFGPCDILINGAGGNNPRGTTDDEQFDAAVEGVKTFFDLDPAGVRFVFDLNVIAALMTTQVFAKDMIGRGGNIMNVSSMNAFRPLTKIPAYSGAKSAVSNFTQWLATYLAKSNIRVNAIAPGWIDTPMFHKAVDNDPPRKAKIMGRIPAKSVGDAMDIGMVTAFLCSDAARYISGTCIPVDGGALIGF